MNNVKNFQALGRLKAGQMNATEKRYAERLSLLKQAGEVAEYWFNAMNLKLADNCYYRTDFMVLTKDMQLEVHEVKGGYMTDDALIKIKTAAEKFPFRFVMCKYVKKEWEFREF